MFACLPAAKNVAGQPGLVLAEEPGYEEARIFVRQVLIKK